MTSLRWPAAAVPDQLAAWGAAWGRALLSAAASWSTSPGDTSLVEHEPVLADQRTELSGTLQSAANIPAPDYFVVAFAADRTFWRPGSRRVRSERALRANAGDSKSVPHVFASASWWIEQESTEITETLSVRRAATLLPRFPSVPIESFRSAGLAASLALQRRRCTSPAASRPLR